MKSQIRFADDKVKESFEKLKNSKTEDKKLYEWINRALDDFEENAFSGVISGIFLVLAVAIVLNKISEYWLIPCMILLATLIWVWPLFFMHFAAGAIAGLFVFYIQLLLNKAEGDPWMALFILILSYLFFRKWIPFVLSKK